MVDFTCTTNCLGKFQTGSKNVDCWANKALERRQHKTNIQWRFRTAYRWQWGQGASSSWRPVFFFSFTGTKLALKE